MAVPKLRFKADDGSQFPDWEEKTFNDVADYKKGPFGSALKKEIFVPKSNDTVKVYEQQNAISKDWKLERYFVTNEYFQSKMKSFAVSGGDIIVSCAGTIGEMYELPHDAEEGIINQALMRVRIKKSVINSMIFRCVFDKMISTEGVKISNGSALKNIPPFADMKKQSVFVPSLPEQQKIADFLSTIDTVIEKQKETVSAWEKRKKGVMQKLFSQEVRFKADDGSEFPDWEEKKLNEIAVRVTRKNKDNVTDIPLTISSADGLIDQRNFFNKVVASKDMSGYFLLKNGEFAYNKSYSKGYNFGSIKRLDLYDEGALSTLYICFALNKNENSDFYQKYFDSLSWYPELQKICAEGARNHGLLNVPTNDFFQLKLCVPSSDKEQHKIADCLSSLDEVIEKQKATLAAWEELKKGLLQQMFV